MSQPKEITRTPAEWLGYFYGHDLTFLHAETIAIKSVPAKLLKKEAELMQVKWFDYRRMHPTKATYYLASEYSKAYGNAISVMQDGETGKYIKGFKGLDFMDSRERLAFWRLRQGIDALGIRYDFFLRFVMNICIENGWLNPPRPCHIMSDPDVVVAAMVAWEDECRIKIQFCKDERYKVSNFFGHADQIAYESFITKQIKTRVHQHYSLHASLYVEQAIRIESAIQNFDEQTLERVFEYASIK